MVKFHILSPPSCPSFYYIYLLCVHGCVCATEHIQKSQHNVESSTVWVLEMKLGHYTWQQEPLPSEASCRYLLLAFN